MNLSGKHRYEISNNLPPPIEKLFDSLSVPSSNRSQEESWNILIQHIQEQKDLILKRKSLLLQRIVSIAAAFIIFIISLAYLKFNKTEVITAKGQILTIQLPDKSEVQINACSKIQYSRFWLLNAREVFLEGEAFFRVKKGKTFTVNTFSNHKIEVIGTKFNVYARNNEIKVTCYEGKVRMLPVKGENVILSAGFESRITNDTLILYQYKYSHKTMEQPSWTSGEFYFEAAPVSAVIAELMRQYPIKIQTINFDPAQRFYSGYFTNKNLTQALELITVPMDLKYVFVNDTLIHIYPIQ